MKIKRSDGQGWTRRGFLTRVAGASAAAAVVFPTVVPARALGRAQVAAPGERITLGVIGYGPRCHYDLPPMLAQADVQVVALCDIQASRRDEGKQAIDSHYGNSDCKTYRDLRELLDRKDIDAVLIATGDRWHGPGSIMAAKAGKDVYSEKPCGLTIRICQELARTFAETGRVFQAGTQRRSVANFQAAVALARSGKLGKLHTLHASVYQPVIDNTWLPGEPTPPRDEIDWDLWLGAAPWRPFNPKYVQGRWRGYWDFDSGARLLDWAAHTLDLCQQAAGADDTMPVTYEATDTAITATYKDGVKIVMAFLQTPFADRPGWNNDTGTCPVRFEGDEGWVETGDNGLIVTSSPALKEAIGPLPEPSPSSGLDVAAHARNFLDAIKSRQPTAANAQIMKNSHIACHAAALSWILGRTLKLDPLREEFRDDPEANALCSRPARTPWSFQ